MTRLRVAGLRRMCRQVRPALRRGAVAVLAAIAMTGCTPANLTAQQQEEHGAALYQANCATCHGGATGGDIADIPPRHNAEGHTWHHLECELLAIIRNGMPHRSGLPDDAPTMPAFRDRLTDDEIRAILAHIKTWWTDQQQQFQSEVTDQACT
ncbi:MAG: cytochrome c [Actinobacteria bacterium]|nr:cytochrome c [Actinomycetota bacterium]